MAVSISGYQVIEDLYESSNSLVYCGRRNTDNQSVILKMLKYTASRLEGLTKIYGASILISDRTLADLQDPSNYNFRFLDKVKVKGKQDAVSVFEVLDGETECLLELKLKTRTNFEEGLFHYHGRNFSQANLCFSSVLAINADDKAAQLYLQRVNRFKKYGVPDNWEGIEALIEK